MTAGREEPNPRRWQILNITLVAGFMTLIDLSSVNVALPSIQRDFQASPATVQWLVSGYALAYGMTPVIGGRLGDALGRRAMLVVGLVGFLAASAAVGLAPTIGVAIAARVVQGVAAGMLTPQNIGLIQELFRGAERGRAFGRFGLVLSAATALGPAVGGIILGISGQDIGWRLIFLINLPIGLVALVMIMRLLPRRPARAARVRIANLDIPGALLLGAAVLSVLFPVISAIRYGPTVLLAAVMAPVFAWLFVRREAAVLAAGGEPLLNVELLRTARGFAGGVGVIMFYFMGFTGVFLVVTVYLQTYLGESPLTAALLVTPYAVGSVIASPISGRWVSRIGRWVTVIGLSINIAGWLLVLLLTHTGAGPLWLTLAPAMFVAGLGGGAIISPNQALSLEDVPTRMAGAAGGALQTSQRIGSALGSAFLIAAFYGVINAGQSPTAALQVSLGVAAVMMIVALVLAVRDLRDRTPSPVGD